MTSETEQHVADQNGRFGVVPKTRIIAFYLPQYHPIPENDAWWGTGFTEWRNVVAAKPLFRSHYQPRLPSDLGFYDLRVAETREAQAELASASGIDAFCYYHYWFEGKRLLERPLESVLASGSPSLPFCLCWANETWSRTWLGDESEVLLGQTYSAKDDATHASFLAGVMGDDRYLTWGGRPIFLVYRPWKHPEPRRFTDLMRMACLERGLAEPWLIGVDAAVPAKDAREVGFDATLRFEPTLAALPGYRDDSWNFRKLLRNMKMGKLSGALKVYDYGEACKAMRRSATIDAHESVFVSWDNSARRGRSGIVLVNADPALFGKRVSDAIAHAATSREQMPPLVFVNAWNEWAEGNHLEPDQRFGHAWLNALRAAKDGAMMSGMVLEKESDL